MSSLNFDSSKYYFQTNIYSIPWRSGLYKNLNYDTLIITQTEKLSNNSFLKGKALTTLIQIRDHLKLNTLVFSSQEDYTVTDVAKIVFQGYSAKKCWLSWIWETIQWCRGVETETVKIQIVFNEILCIEKNKPDYQKLLCANHNTLTDIISGLAENMLFDDALKLAGEIQDEQARESQKSALQVGKLLQDHAIDAAIDLFVQLKSEEAFKQAKEYLGRYFQSPDFENLAPKKLIEILTEWHMYDAAFKVADRFLPFVIQMKDDIRRAQKFNCSYYDLDIIDSLPILDGISPAYSLFVYKLMNR